MVLTRERTRLKNRIHATLAKYGLRLEGTSDLFGRRGRQWLSGTALPALAPHSRYATARLLEQLDVVVAQIDGFERRLRAVFAPTPELQLLRTLPGVGEVLAVVIWFEIGDCVGRSSFSLLSASEPTPHFTTGCSREPLDLRSDPYTRIGDSRHWQTRVLLA